MSALPLDDGMGNLNMPAREISLETTFMIPQGLEKETTPSIGSEEMITTAKGIGNFA